MVLRHAGVADPRVVGVAAGHEVVEVAPVGVEPGERVVGRVAVARHEHLGARDPGCERVEPGEVGGQVVGSTRQRQLDVGEHVAGEQDTAVGQPHRGVPGRVAVVHDDLDRLPRRGQPVAVDRLDGSEQREQLGRPAGAHLVEQGGALARRERGRARRRPPRRGAEPRVPEQVVVVGVRAEPGGHRQPALVEQVGQPCQLAGPPGGVDEERVLAVDDDGRRRRVDRAGRHQHAGCDLDGGHEGSRVAATWARYASPRGETR